MVDYYWLKSFSEIMQLFLSVLFLTYLRVKFDRPTPIIHWLAIFFYIKLATDLYGILNYTPWISEILTRPILNVYRVAMGSFEVGMIASLVLFSFATIGKEFKRSYRFCYFIPAILLFPINLILYKYFQSSLVEIFDTVKCIWIGTSLYLIIRVRSKVLITLLISILLWNALWLIEVVLHQQLKMINESTSWILFVTSEMIITAGLSYFLLQIIAKPRLLRYEKPEDILPVSLMKVIEEKLKIEFEENRIFKDPDLSAASLSEILGITASDLTTYLNRILNKNFNQYIIDYRVDESRRLLKDARSSHMTIEQIMHESGFNSKSVFNTAFKRKTGLTPTQFRKDTS